MYNHNQVAHAWANQTGRARKGFNMFYDGRTIYSHGLHFPIARILDDAVILFTNRGYSTSTAKHKSFTSRAIDRRRYRVFVVENVNANAPAEHLANYEGMVEAARGAIGKAQRVRSRAVWYIDDAERYTNSAHEYAAAFALGVPLLTLESLDAAAAAIAARVEQQLARAQHAREQALRDRELLLGWLQGADVCPPHTRVPYVRVKGDQVETTWGARVPLGDALRAWGAMKHARDARESGDTIPSVGDFNVTKITSTGMRVGCHFIPFKFAQLAARCAGIE